MDRKETTQTFFNDASTYAANAQKMESINANLHFLTHLVLQNLPADAHILCVGVGTGTEILRAAAAFPGWRFTGVEPAPAMLEACRENISKAGISARCTLYEGYLSDIKESERFDAVLCILVTHFIKDIGEREQMFKAMKERLKPKGYLVHAEISYDLSSPKFPNMLESWKAMHRLSGASEEKLSQISETLKRDLAVLPPETTETLLKKVGFAQPIQFFQSLMIHGWYSQRD